MDRGLAALAATPRGEATRSAIQAASGVLEEFRKLDVKSRQYLKSSQPLMASDVIFTDSLTKGAPWPSASRPPGPTRPRCNDAAIDGLRWREFYAAGGAGCSSLFAVLLLAPVPESEVDVLTAMRALTVTPAAGPAARPAPKPPAVVTPRVRTIEFDDLPDLECGARRDRPPAGILFSRGAHARHVPLRTGASAPVARRAPDSTSPAPRACAPIWRACWTPATCPA